jgi:biotin carboxyl carrier protein
MSASPAPQSSIFRKVSLERLSSPERLDSLMRATDPQGWIALITIALLLAGAVVWGFEGSIPIKVSGRGIILRGSALQEVYSLVTGVMNDVYVKPGDVVQFRQPMATVIDAEAVDKMRSIQAVIDQLRTQMAATPEARRPALQAQIDKLQADYDQAEAVGKARGMVLSTAHGRVVEVLADKGDLIQRASHVFYIEPLDKPLDALIYVSASDAGRITTGMAVQINPDNARPEEYGNMKGVVSRIAQYPSSVDDLKRKFGIDQLVAMLVAAGPPVQVSVELQEDKSTPSGYAWTTGKGPSFEIRSGTLCQGAVIIGEQRPIQLVTP